MTDTEVNTKQTPPESPEPGDSKFAHLLGIIIFESCIQAMFTLWAVWVIDRLFGIAVNGFFWWIATVLIFVTLDWYYKTAASYVTASLFCILAVASIATKFL
jgi:hypothetical protein